MAAHCPSVQGLAPLPPRGGWSTGSVPCQCIQRRPALQRRRWRHVQAASSAGGSPSDPDQQWVDNLNRHSIQGPAFNLPNSQQYEPLNPERDLGVTMMGEDGYREWTEIKKGERQRVWDAMREVAADRYAKGEMPSWFDPAWLTQQESPINRLIRESGDPRYQSDDQWLGRSYEPTLPLEELQYGDGGSDDDGRDGRGRGVGGDGEGGGWWREEDPYWMLRDWGSHPMRWYTLGFAALMAAGGLFTYAFHGSVESLFVGWGGGAGLALCSLAMSDMRTGVIGEMGVKAAWVICALLFLKDAVLGWSHNPHSGSNAYNYQDPDSFVASETRTAAPWDFLLPKLPKFNPTWCGWSAVAMCVMYMWTGMGDGLDGSLPMNPGGVYKSPDIVNKHRVWTRWGYGDEVMRV